MRKPFQRNRHDPCGPHGPHDPRPHDLHRPTKVRLIMGFKNFSAWKGISHIGLGVSGLNTCAVLKRNCIHAESIPLVETGDLYHFLEMDRRMSWPGHTPVSHVVISAPWIESHAYRHLCERFPNVIFTVLVHSNVGFLQADPRGVKLIREAAEMQAYFRNFRLAGNCFEFCDWIRRSYGTPCWLLPNLYNLGDNPSVPRRHLWKPGKTLRIGSFGAIRPLKNTMTAAGAVLQITNQFKANTEFWISANRVEGGANCVVSAIYEMLQGTNVTIVPSPWEPWPDFRKTMRKMHLHMQPSYTESFNITVADAISVGVPSVVSPAIAWTPKYWQADPDDVGDMVRVGERLLTDPNAIADGFKALQNYIAYGVEDWKRFLGVR